MSELKSYLKIKSAIRASSANDKIATIVHKGDKDNGSILIKLRRNDSMSCLLGKSLTHEGNYKWTSLFKDFDKFLNLFNSEKIVRQNLNYKGKINFYRHHFCHI